MKKSIDFRSMMLASALSATLALGFTPAAHADYVAPEIHHEPYGDYKVVVPITSADASVWAFRLHNIANGINVSKAGGGALQVKVVLYGYGAKLLVDPDAKTREAIDAARAAGVQFNVCNFSLKGLNMNWHDMYGVKETDIVPSGFAEVGWLASHGWAVNSAN